MEIDCRGEKVVFEGRTLTTEEALQIMPFFKSKLSVEDTEMLVKRAGEILPNAIRCFVDGVTTNGKPVTDLKAFFQLAGTIPLQTDLICDLYLNSQPKRDDEKNSEGQSTSQDQDDATA